MFEENLFAFLVRKEEDLQAVAKQELQVYFHDYSLEKILDLEYAKSEMLETIVVTIEPREPADLEEREDKSFWGLEQTGEKLTTKERAKSFRSYETDELVEEILTTLASERRNSVLVVGLPQVGKSAVIDEVARRIFKEECEKSLHKRNIWLVSAQSIEAMNVWWEAVMKNIIEEALSKNFILYLDSITDFLEGATSYTRGSEMAKFLKPYISSGQIVVIGETTLERYTAYLGRSGGFLEQLKTIRVEEPSQEKASRILNAVRRSLEQTYIVVFHPLSRGAMRKIAKKELDTVLLRDGLLRWDCLVEIDDGFLDLLVEKGFSPAYGARPLKREIEKRVTQAIGNYLATHTGDQLPLLHIAREGDSAKVEAVVMREAKGFVQLQRSDSFTVSDILERKVGVRDIARRFSDQRRKLRDWLESDKVEELRRQKSKAVKETSKKDFWKRKEEDRRAHPKRIYQLERLLTSLSSNFDVGSRIREPA